MAGPPPQLETDDLEQLVDTKTAEKIKSQNRREAETFLVLPENWQVVQLLGFINGGCWKYAPMGGIVGMDYLQIESLLKLLGHTRKKRQKLFSKLRWIERGALSHFNKRKG